MIRLEKDSEGRYVISKEMTDRISMGINKAGDSFIAKLQAVKNKELRKELESLALEFVQLKSDYSFIQGIMTTRFYVPAKGD